MTERPNAITFKGNPMTLSGEPLEVGKAPAPCQMTGTDLKPVTLDAFKGKVVLLSAVPSLDTGVCDTQARRFNEAAGQLEGVEVVVVSMDLPFAQKRWCGAADANNLTTLSDYKDHSFGQATGLRIKELGLLTRAVLVLDAQGVVQYQQVVSEVTDQPDYDAAIEAAKKAAA